MIAPAKVQYKKTEKLVVVIMGQNCEKLIGMCLESVKEADAIVYCDGGSSPEFHKFLIKKVGEICYPKNNFESILNDYDQEDKGMNGKQRNFYLDYIKKNYPDYWCLCLDADEVVEDLGEIKKMIQRCNKGLYSIKMRHLIGDLAHEDAIVPEHHVLNRLFKIREAGKYPEIEHPVLKGGDEYMTNITTIWHLAYCPNMWDIKKRYDNHMKKSQIHTPKYLKNWYYQHLFGQYPKKEFNPLELPKIITDEFNIDRDELYFKDRGLETKHFIDAIHWRDYFKPKRVLEYGCGRGPRVYAMRNLDVSTVGMEISKYAVDNALDDIILRDVIKDTRPQKFEDQGIFDLVIAYDLLEHIEYKKLDIVINNMIERTNKHILVSIPFKGTPNCDNDPTHIIKEDRDWWVKQFTDKGLKQVEVPEHFLFKEQLLIFSK